MASSSKPQYSQAEFEDIILRKIFLFSSIDSQAVYLEMTAAENEGKEFELSWDLLKRIFFSGDCSLTSVPESSVHYLIDCLDRAHEELMIIRNMNDKSTMPSPIYSLVNQARELCLLKLVQAYLMVTEGSGGQRLTREQSLFDDESMKLLSNNMDEFINGKNMAANLTVDLITEILLRMPTVSLLRFRCVCKAWFQLIKSPRFIHMHLQHNASKNDCILVIRTHDTLNPTLSFHNYESFKLINSFESDFDLDYINVSGPCNGLMCHIDEDNHVVLSNTSTGEYRWLPSLYFQSEKDYNQLVNSFGLGFVSNTNDYKVVCFVDYDYVPSEDEDDYDYFNMIYKNIKVYNLSTNSWRVIECGYQYYYIMAYQRNGIYFNGALHWTSQVEDIITILTFDMTTEVFCTIDLPKDLQGKREVIKFYYLTVLNNNDTLGLFAFTKNNQKLQGQQFVEIWVMKEYGVVESWSKQANVGHLSGISRPLMLWKNRTILLKGSENQLLSCSLDTHEIEELEVQGEKGSIMSVMLFHESLVPLDSLDDES